MGKRDENFKIEKLVLTVTVEKHTPLHKNQNKLYMELGGVHFLETDTHFVTVNMMPLGGHGPVVQIHRKNEDDMSCRHYAIDVVKFAEAVLFHEGSKGNMRHRKAETANG